MRLEYFEACGTWYDIGFAEGKAYGETMQYIIHLYACYHAGDPRLKVLDKAADLVVDFLKGSFPEELEKLKGIAGGAKIALPLLLAANYPDVIKTLVGKPVPGIPTACSNIMFPDSEWGPLVGGTLDDNPTRIILHCRPDDGLAFTCIHWPGLLGPWGGMNSAGLAICGASSKALLKKNKRTDARISGLNMLGCNHVLLRSCRTVDEALEKMRRPDMGSIEHLSLMDATGRGVQVQGYIGDSLEIRVVEMPADQGLCCGNYYTWEIKPDDYPLYPDKQDTFSRYAGLQRTVNVNTGNYSVGLMKAALTSHDGNPNKGESVCNCGTMAAMIAAPKAGKLLFASKPPCMNGFHEYCV